MLVYRLEYGDGRGIYSGALGFLVNRQALSQDDFSATHPSPQNDEGLAKWWDGPWKLWNKPKLDWHQKGRLEYVCGFADEAQMLDWFPPEGFRFMLDELAKDGEQGYRGNLRVAVYKVAGPKVRKGTHQVMFRKEDAELVENRPLSHYSG